MLRRSVRRAVQRHSSDGLGQPPRSDKEVAEAIRALGAGCGEGRGAYQRTSYAAVTTVRRAVVALLRNRVDVAGRLAFGAAAQLFENLLMPARVLDVIAIAQRAPLLRSSSTLPLYKHLFSALSLRNDAPRAMAVYYQHLHPAFTPGSPPCDKVLRSLLFLNAAASRASRVAEPRWFPLSSDAVLDAMELLECGPLHASAEASVATSWARDASDMLGLLAERDEDPFSPAGRLAVVKAAQKAKDYATALLHLEGGYAEPEPSLEESFSYSGHTEYPLASANGNFHLEVPFRISCGQPGLSESEWTGGQGDTSTPTPTAIAERLPRPERRYSGHTGSLLTSTNGNSRVDIQIPCLQPGLSESGWTGGQGDTSTPLEPSHPTPTGRLPRPERRLPAEAPPTPGRLPGAGSAEIAGAADAAGDRATWQDFPSPAGGGAIVSDATLSDVVMTAAGHEESVFLRVVTKLEGCGRRLEWSPHGLLFGAAAHDLVAWGSAVANRQLATKDSSLGITEMLLQLHATRGDVAAAEGVMVTRPHGKVTTQMLWKLVNAYAVALLTAAPPRVYRRVLTEHRVRGALVARAVARATLAAAKRGKPAPAESPAPENRQRLKEPKHGADGTSAFPSRARSCKPPENRQTPPSARAQDPASPPGSPATPSLQSRFPQSSRSLHAQNPASPPGSPETSALQSSSLHSLHSLHAQGPVTPAEAPAPQVHSQQHAQGPETPAEAPAPQFHSQQHAQGPLSPSSPRTPEASPSPANLRTQSDPGRPSLAATFEFLTTATLASASRLPPVALKELGIAAYLQHRQDLRADQGGVPATFPAFHRRICQPAPSADEPPALFLYRTYQSLASNPDTSGLSLTLLQPMTAVFVDLALACTSEDGRITLEYRQWVDGLRALLEAAVCSKDVPASFAHCVAPLRAVCAALSVDFARASFASQLQLLALSSEPPPPAAVSGGFWSKAFLNSYLRLCVANAAPGLAWEALVAAHDEHAVDLFEDDGIYLRMYLASL
ncbi:hypothetical protein DIPPA_26240 [Diplonema papillatum]|nr:hypothetical protein DIPPA_26240 [Diplonema papillatum]